MVKTVLPSLLMNSMKIITLLLTFLNILTLNGNYQTKEEIFLTNIKDAYEKYTINDCTTVVGKMYVVVGNVNGEKSLSLFFNNEVSNAYTVRIKKNDKLYVLSNYDDYQIYYNIKAKDTDTFVIELITKNGSTPYYAYQVDLTKYDTTGNGLNNFPYHTKLKNKASIVVVCLFFSIPLVLIEALILIIVLRKKNKNKISNSDNQTVYNNIAYTIEDNNEKE